MDSKFDRVHPLRLLLSWFSVQNLSGSLGEAETDQECVEAVTVACNSLPISFGGQRSQSGRLGEGNARVAEGSELWRGAFKTRLLAVFVSALLSRRKVPERVVNVYTLFPCIGVLHDWTVWLFMFLFSLPACRHLKRAEKVLKFASVWQTAFQVVINFFLFLSLGCPEK